MRSDAELLREYVDLGSDAAFAELVRRHAGLVYAAAYRRVGGDVHLAAEVAQGVFGDLARKARALAQRESLMGWLFVSTRFAAAKALRARARQDELRRSAAALADTPAHRAEAEVPDLAEALERLGSADRDAVLLRFFEACSFAEIGLRLGVSESAARMRVERALEKLRVRWARRGVMSAAAAVAAALEAEAAVPVPTGLAARLVATGAAHGSGSAVGTGLIFMASTKTVVATAVALAVLAGGAAVWHRDRVEIDALRVQVRQQTEEAATLRAGLRHEQSELAVSRMHLAAKGSVAVVAAPTTPAAEPDAVVIHSREVSRMHPEYDRLQRNREIRYLLLRYRDGIASLHLPESIEKQLKQILVQRELASTDASDAATSVGLARNSKAFGKAIADSTRDFDKQITALIGADALETLEASQHSGGSNVDMYDIELSEAGQPLTQVQKLTLSKMLNHAADAAPLEAMSWATRVLTPSQAELFHAVWEEQRQTRQIETQYLPKNFNGPMVVVP